MIFYPMLKLSQFQNRMFVLIRFMIFEKLLNFINHHKINGFKTEAALNYGKIVSNEGHGKNSISRDQAENISISRLLAELFNSIKNGSSFITSKSLSKNLSNENKHWCFCRLQDKMRNKTPILWKHRL